jgi:hypothetical protein
MSPFIIVVLFHLPAFIVVTSTFSFYYVFVLQNEAFRQQLQNVGSAFRSVSTKSVIDISQSVRCKKHLSLPVLKQSEHCFMPGRVRGITTGVYL